MANLIIKDIGKVYVKESREEIVKMIYCAGLKNDTDVNFIELTSRHKVKTRDDTGSHVFKKTSYNISYIISVSE